MRLFNIVYRQMYLLLAIELGYLLLLFCIFKSLWSNRDVIGTNIVPYMLMYIGLFLFILCNILYFSYKLIVYMLHT